MIARHAAVRAEFMRPVVLTASLAGFLTIAGRLEPGFIAGATQLELATQVFETALLAVPMTLVLISGGIDLSIGATMALSSAAFGMSFESGAPIWACAACAILAATCAGAFNGACVVRLAVHPLIVTLATLSLFRGVAEGISRGRPVSGFPESFTELGDARWFGVPPAGWGFALAWAAALIWQRRTRGGRWITAIGWNETAARFSGVPVDRIKLLLYTLCGTAAGAAAVLFIARRNTAKADIGLGIELEVITAVVLGGTSASGGRGSLLGTLLGLALLHEVRQFISWRWNNDELILLVVGAMLIGSMLLNRTKAS
ncbi:MAG: ABC transporter permease [Phycisphaerae bacterium]|nr:MAG: ABC transporter permease [Planctomycetota bacterium]KAB2948946.1 MAG: ABC transporter permease [Phycisphaerae bacterium]MBE7456002.1 ABC transporter permease [Planctomycetia bacterium]MCK6465129.1 ABC transporter permease [Phycisphaerae bacterium]MCL4717260.1 ABC transporter permease [Phycisphaerae bacterium]